MSRRRRRARQVAVHGPVGGQPGAAGSREVRVAVPPAAVRPADGAAGAAQRRRWRRRHGHQPRCAARRHGHQPVRRRVLPGRSGNRTRVRHGVRRHIRHLCFAMLVRLSENNLISERNVCRSGM
jgi:hypothetical protein